MAGAVMTLDRIVYLSGLWPALELVVAETSTDSLLFDSAAVCLSSLLALSSSSSVPLNRLAISLVSVGELMAACLIKLLLLRVMGGGGGGAVK